MTEKLALSAVRPPSALFREAGVASGSGPSTMKLPPTLRMATLMAGTDGDPENVGYNSDKHDQRSCLLFRQVDSALASSHPIYGRIYKKCPRRSLKLMRTL